MSRRGRWTVRIGPALVEAVVRVFPDERLGPGGSGRPGEPLTGGPGAYDFFGGPLAAAVAAFTRFEALTEEVGPTVRSFWTVDPRFGTVVFVGVRVGDREVEIADFALDVDDPDVGVADAGDATIR